MKRLIVPAITALLAQSVMANVKDIEEASAASRNLLDAIYQRPDVTAYCEQDPMPKDPIVIRIHDMDLPIYCDARKQRLDELRQLAQRR